MQRQLVTALCAVLLLASRGAAQTPETIKVTNLTDKLYLLTTDQGTYTTNSLAFVGDDGVLLVDTQSENEMEDFKTVIDGFGKGAPKYIISTHRHVEHIGGNALFGADPVIIAHHLFPERLRSGSYLFNEFPDETFPDITFVDSMTLRFNGETIRMFSVAGSHDDNEIAVHFVESKVAHISSITNGFNFPSIDSDGDVFKFAACVTKAQQLLPEDVRLVSGHNPIGEWSEFQPYIDMVNRSLEIVKAGLDAGKDLKTLQDEKVLAEFEHYAGSYVDANGWIESLVDGYQNLGQPKKKKLQDPLYYAWKDGGVDAAIEKYHELKRNQANVYDFNEFILLSIGSKLGEKGYYDEAIAFLELGLQEFPDAQYRYYTYYIMATVRDEQGQTDAAIAACEKALELKPDFKTGAALLEELKKK